MEKLSSGNAKFLIIAPILFLIFLGSGMSDMENPANPARVQPMLAHCGQILNQIVNFTLTFFLNLKENDL